MKQSFSAETIIPSSKRARIVCFLYVFLYILESSAFMQSTELNLSGVRIFDRILNVGFLIYIVTHFSGFKKNKTGLYLIPILFWIIDYLSPATNTSVFSLLATFTVVFYCLEDLNTQALSYLFLRVAIVIMSVFGIIAYLFYISGFIQPFSMVDFYEEGSTNLYANYYFSYLYVAAGGALCRLCGLFNEPGWMGTLCALILIVERMNLRRIGNIVIFVAGFLSYSMAFWLLIGIFVVLHSIMSFNKYSVFAIVFLLLVPVIVSNIQTDNENVLRLLSRFAFENGSLAGDDRTTDELMFLWLEVLSDPMKLLFGIGRSIEHTTASSFLQLFVQYGIVGTAVVFIPLFVLALKNCAKNKSAIVLLLCFFASIYQRPQVISLGFFIVLIGGTEFLKLSDKIKNSNN